jgi:outer membrane protein TolC
LSIEDAVATALKNNYDIRLMRNDSALLSLNEKFANSVFLPRVNATSNMLFTNNDAKQKFTGGAIRERNNIRATNFNTSVNLNWTLFDGLKMFATRERSMEFSRLGDLQMKTRISATVAEVINTYYNIVRQKQQIKAIEEQIALSEEVVKVAEKRFETGLGAKPALLQSKVDLNARKASRERESLSIDRLKVQLNQLMAVAADARYEVTDSIPVNHDLSLPDILQTTETSNPDMLLARQQIKISEAGLKETKAQRFPVLSFNSTYNFTRNDNKAVVNEFTPLFNRNSGYNYGLGLSIPIFNNFTVKRQIQEAGFDLEYRKLLFDYQRAINNSSVINAFRAYEMNKKLLQMEEENITLARENVYIAKERLRLGASGYIEFREAQRSLEDAYYRLTATRFDFKVSETELLRLKGDLVK